MSELRDWLLSKQQNQNNTAVLEPVNTEVSQPNVELRAWLESKRNNDTPEVAQVKIEQTQPQVKVEQAQPQVNLDPNELMSPQFNVADPQDVGYKPQEVQPLSKEAVNAAARGTASGGSALLKMGSTIADVLMRPSMPATSGASLGMGTIPQETTAQVKARQETVKSLEDKAAFLWEVSKNKGIAPQRKDLMGDITNLAMETVPYITATSLGYLAAGPLGGFAVGSMVEGNTAYRTALDSGVDENKAKAIGLGVGLVSGAIETFGGKLAEKGVDKVLKKIVGNKLRDKITRGGLDFSLGTVIEAFEEGTQELAQLTGESTYRDIDIKEALDRVLGSMAGGAFLGGAMKGGATALRVGAGQTESLIQEAKNRQAQSGEQIGAKQELIDSINKNLNSQKETIPEQEKLKVDFANRDKLPTLEENKSTGTATSEMAADTDTIPAKETSDKVSSAASVKEEKKEFEGWHTTVNQGEEQMAEMQSSGLPAGKFIALDKPFESEVHNVKNAQKVKVNVKNVYDPDGVIGEPTPVAITTKELQQLSDSIQDKENVKDYLRQFRQKFADLLISKGYDAYARGIDGDPKNRELIILNQTPSTSPTAPAQSPSVQTPTSPVSQEQGQGRVEITDVTPEGYGPAKETETSERLHDVLPNETADEAYARYVGYRIDGGAAKLEETRDGWKATIPQLDGKPRIIQAYKKDKVMELAYKELYPGYKFANTSLKSRLQDILTPKEEQGEISNVSKDAVIMTADETKGGLYISETVPTKDENGKIKHKKFWAKPGKFIREFINTVPEFSEEPFFTVKDGQLIYQDGGRYKIKPEFFGIDPASIKEGQVIQIDYESYGAKKPSQSKITKAKKTNLKAPAEVINEIVAETKTSTEVAPTTKKKKKSKSSSSTLGKAATPGMASNEVDRAIDKQSPMGGLTRKGSTTIIPDTAEEVKSWFSQIIYKPYELVKASIKIVRRNVKRGNNHIRTLGSAGKTLAEDIDNIVFVATKRSNNDVVDTSRVFKGMSHHNRTLIAKVVNGRISEDKVSERIKQKVKQLREILDRSMIAANEEAEMTRKVKGKKIPIGGSGKAFPQVPNKQGQAFLDEAEAKGLSSKKVFIWATEQVKAGKFEDVDNAVTALQIFRQNHLRGINRYLESTRVELPEQYIEWDGAKILPNLFERNWLTIEAVKKWGDNFGLVNSRTEQIASEYGRKEADRVNLFIKTSFGVVSPASAESQSISNIIRGYQYTTKVGLSPLTIFRNMTDRLAKALTLTINPITNIQATIQYPPFLNSFINSAQKIEDDMIRRGAVFGHGSLSEGYEAGNMLADLASKPFSASERGNQVYIAYVKYLQILKDINTLQQRMGEDSILNRIAKRINIPLQDSLKYRISEYGGNKIIEAINNKEAVTDDLINEVLHRAVRDKAYPMVISTKPLWYDTHPMAKVIAQFKTWPMQQTAMIWNDVVKYTVKTGDPARLIGFLLGTLIAGELYNIIRDFLYEKDESILNNVKDGNKEISKAILGDLIDGGIVGMLADFTYGIFDWVTGVSWNTGTNIKEAVVSSYKQPKLTVSVITRLIQKEVTPVRQVMKLIDKIDRKYNENNITKDYYRIRDLAWQYKNGYLNPTTRDKMIQITDDLIYGKTTYKPGDNTLAYQMASRQLQVGDIQDAAKFFSVIMQNGGTKSTLMRTMRSNYSPYGHVKKEEQNNFLKSLNPEDKKRAENIQKKWEYNLSKAINNI